MQVLLASAPTYLEKYKREDHWLQPFFISGWIKHRHHHRLCSVSYLRKCVQLITQAPNSLKPCQIRHLKSYQHSRSCRASKGPGNSPGRSNSIAFLCSLHRRSSAACQWSSSTAFAERYLAFHVRDTPYVAIGSLLEKDLVSSSSSLQSLFEAFPNQSS